MRSSWGPIMPLLFLLGRKKKKREGLFREPEIVYFIQIERSLSAPLPQEKSIPITIL